MPSDSRSLNRQFLAMLCGKTVLCGKNGRGDNSRGKNLRRLAVLPLVAALATGLAPFTAATPVAAAERPDSFADLSEKLLPSVVNISTSQVIRQRPGQRDFEVPPGSPFPDLFREFFENGPGGRPAPERRATSLGSGFIIDSSGLVVTNNHVIADADEITVILQDDSRHEARVLGRDSKTDLALLQFDPGRDVPAVSWGNSTRARVGDWVLAIGNPFALGGTVTAGIISARQRNINAGPYDSFIQTDASINRGNSGGPLFNLQGEVIGVNTAIFSPTGSSVGIGFAIPSEIATLVISQLREFGETRRGWLGVRIQTVTEEIARSLDMEQPAGALVSDLSTGGPALAAGIEAGDVILSFDGKTVDVMHDLPRIVAETDIGKEVEVRVWRRGEAKNLTVTVGQLQEDEPFLVGSGIAERDKAEQKFDALGLVIARLTRETRQEYEVDSMVTTGVVITAVAENSPAARKNLRAGDIILEAGQEPVNTPGDFAAQVAKAGEKGSSTVLLRVRRDDDFRFVALQLE